VGKRGGDCIEDQDSLSGHRPQTTIRGNVNVVGERQAGMECAELWRAGTGALEAALGRGRLRAESVYDETPGGGRKGAGARPRT
jgi:hypothetical protein